MMAYLSISMRFHGKEPYELILVDSEDSTLFEEEKKEKNKRVTDCCPFPVITPIH